jgi:hypothetical protein
LEWGSHVWAKVISFNVYGESPISDEGNGGLLLTIPDPPINLIEIVGTRGATQIGVEWTKATEDGGTPVIDYLLEYHDETTTTFTPLDPNVLATSYLATGLTTGSVYTFRVAARNVHGHSTVSN